MEESGNDAWTDEKHLQYLNSMEASFVCTMIQTKNCKSLLRLDRHLHNTSDLKSQRTSNLKPLITSSDIRRRMDSRVGKRLKKSKSSQDEELRDGFDKALPIGSVRKEMVKDLFDIVIGRFDVEGNNNIGFDEFMSLSKEMMMAMARGIGGSPILLVLHQDSLILNVVDHDLPKSS